MNDTDRAEVSGRTGVVVSATQRCRVGMYTVIGREVRASAGGHSLLTIPTPVGTVRSAVAAFAQDDWAFGDRWLLAWTKAAGEEQVLVAAKVRRAPHSETVALAAMTCEQCEDPQTAVAAASAHVVLGLIGSPLPAFIASGDLSTVPVEALIHTLGRQRRSVFIHVASSHGFGTLRLDRDETQAAWNGEVGPDAHARIVRVDHGVFLVTATETPQGLEPRRTG